MLLTPGVLLLAAVSAGVGPAAPAQVAPGVAHRLSPARTLELPTASSLPAHARPRGGYGVRVELHGASLALNGSTHRVENGTWVWRMQLRSAGAHSLSAHLDGVRVEPGDALYVYSGTHGHGAGRAYSHSAGASRRSEQLVTAPLPGEALVLEYCAAPGSPAAAGPPLRVRAAIVGVRPTFGIHRFGGGGGGGGLGEGGEGLSSGGDGGNGGNGGDDHAAVRDDGAAPAAAAEEKAGGLPTERVPPKSSAAAAGGTNEDRGHSRRARVHNSSWTFDSLVSELEYGVHASEAAHLSCQVNPSCPEVEQWSEVTRGVALVLNEYGALCSGSLVNTLTPAASGGRGGARHQYFLTAFHCIREVVEAPAFDVANESSTWLPFLFVFNWVSPSCHPSRAPSSRRALEAAGVDAVFGAHIRAYGNDSDFALLEIEEPIPRAYNVRYNGWDATAAVPAGAFVVHHPEGDLMKVAVERDALRLGLFGGQGYHQTIAHTRRTWQAPHWYVQHYELGSTESASSGAPLFSPDGLVVGVLHGGFATCEDPSHDWFGRLSYMFHNRLLFEQGIRHGQLQPWLDPGATARLRTRGADGEPHANVPSADAGLMVQPKLIELGAVGAAHVRAERRRERHEPSAAAADPVRVRLSLLARPTAPVAVYARAAEPAAPGAHARAHGTSRRGRMRRESDAHNSLNRLDDMDPPPEQPAPAPRSGPRAGGVGKASLPDATSKAPASDGGAGGPPFSAALADGSVLVAVLADAQAPSDARADAEAAPWFSPRDVQLPPALVSRAVGAARHKQDQPMLQLCARSADAAYDGVVLDLAIATATPPAGGRHAQPGTPPGVQFETCVRVLSGTSQLPGLLPGSGYDVRSCYAKCRGSPFFGLAASRCVCASRLGAHLSVVPSDCGPPCASEVDTDVYSLCGSEYYVAVYTTGAHGHEHALELRGAPRAQPTGARRARGAPALRPLAADARALARRALPALAVCCVAALLLAARRRAISRRRADGGLAWRSCSDRPLAMHRATASAVASPLASAAVAAPALAPMH